MKCSNIVISSKCFKAGGLNSASVRNTSAEISTGVLRDCELGLLVLKCSTGTNSHKNTTESWGKPFKRSGNGYSCKGGPCWCNDQSCNGVPILLTTISPLAHYRLRKDAFNVTTNTKRTCVNTGKNIINKQQN